MITSPRGRLPAPGAVFAILLAATLYLPVTAVSVVAQQSEAELESAFDLALGRYERELSLYQQATFRVEQALVEVTAARASGDSGRLAEALAASHGRAGDEVTQGQVVARAQGELREAALALVAVLEAREVELLELLSSGPLTPSSEVAVERDWRRVRMRTLEIDRLLDRIGGGIEENLDLRPVVRLQEDPRDTPADLRVKAEILEDFGASYEAIIRDMDLRIAELERRDQQTRAQRDFLADIGRYDDLTPGGRLARISPEARVNPDASEPRDVLAQLDPVELLVMFRAIRERAVENQILVMEQANVFRDRASGPPR